MTDDLHRAILDIVGPKGAVTDRADMEPYLREERGLFHGETPLVVRPASTDEVAAVVAACARHGAAIVPQGGNTGLVGGAVAAGEVLLSLGRMNRVREVDPVNETITVEAGCVLSDVQAAAEEAGLLLPLSLAAEGSCQIGGNLSTNAGGVNVVRYGNARELTLGVEVVLADGRVWNGLRGLRKDNTGYDLKQLFIGSEGTLGIITAAVLKLFPRPRAVETAMAALPSVAAVVELFRRARSHAADALTAFELVPRIGLDFGTRHVAGVADPFTAPHPWYALVELSSPDEGRNLRESLETVLGGAFEDGLVADAVIAESGSQAEQLWRIRETIPEAQKHEGGSIKHDVSIPISRVAEFMDRAVRSVEADIPGVRVCAFGHVGDGNIHFNLSQPEGAEREAFLAKWDHVNRIVHDIVADLGGSFSAEHGIGRLKTGELRHYRPAVELDLMRAVKRALDPEGRLNPGKVVDPV